MSKLEKKIIIKGKIEALTGLLIGGSGSAMSIGAPDKQVIRNPLTNKPYIPGSSLKGKMRSLIEIRDGHLSKDNGPTNNPEHIAAQLFGYVGSKDNNQQKQPSRLIVRDGELLNGDDFPETDLLFTEAKTENSINRITAEANPRTFERVPKGAFFELEMVINILDIDKSKDKFLDTIYEGLKLLENDYLGGNAQKRYSIKRRIKTYLCRRRPAFQISSQKRYSIKRRIKTWAAIVLRFCWSTLRRDIPSKEGLRRWN